MPSDQSFLTEFQEVLVIQVISDRDRPLVPVVPLTGLVTTEQQDRLATRVELEQHSDRSTLGRSQFLHRLMTRTVDPAHHRSTEIRATFRKQIDPVGHGLSLCVGQRRPPLDELIGDLDLPHPTSMSYCSS